MDALKTILVTVSRDAHGKFLWAIADYYGVTTNMIAEVRALLQMCINEGILQVDIESDSMILVKVLKNEISTPWACSLRSEEE